MVLGKPVTRVVHGIGMARQIDGVTQGITRTSAFRHWGQIKNG